MTPRERLVANRTYHVHSQGDDAKDGLSMECAFKTWSRAVRAAAQLDLNNYQVTLEHCVEPAAAIFTETVRIPPMVGGGYLAIVGSPTVGGTIFDAPGGCFVLDRTGQTNVVFRDMTLRGGGSGLINVKSGSIASIGSGVVFGAAAFAHVYVHDVMSMAYLLTAQYTITGGASYHLFVNGGMLFLEEAQVALEGQLSFPGGFACVMNGGAIQTVGTTFTGQASGPRYSATMNGTISTILGGNEQYFPGSTAGHKATGGQYL